MLVRLWRNGSPYILLEMQIGTAIKEHCMFKIKLQNVFKKKQNPTK